jgi:hypothetical protein
MAQRKAKKVLRSPADIPRHFASDDEEVEFWESHEFSEELWNQLPPAPDWALPPKRPRAAGRRSA